MAQSLRPAQVHATELAPGWTGIYSPFRHGVAFLTDDVWRTALHGDPAQLPEAIRAYLVERRILVDDGYPVRWVADRRDRVDDRVKIDTMFLVVTESCNFDCDYCAVLRNMDPSLAAGNAMSIEVGRRAVDLFGRLIASSRPRDARVTFYGGEPTLNRDLLMDLVPRIREVHYPGQARPVSIVMITNGYRYDEDLVDLFREHQVGVCVSLDGKKVHQDCARRHAATGASTFDTVVKNYTKYREAGLSLGVSTALGKHNVFDLAEICEFYAEGLGARFVEFQIPYQVAAESNKYWVSTKVAAQHLNDAYTVLDSYGVVEATTMRRLRDFMAGRVHARDCGASSHQLVVAPDGSVGPCHSLVGSRTFFSSNVCRPNCDPPSLPDFREWARRYPLNMTECHECPYVALCGGGCTYNSFVSTGSIWNKDPQVCDYMRELVDWILRELWRRSGMAERARQNLAPMAVHQPPGDGATP